MEALKKALKPLCDATFNANGSVSVGVCYSRNVRREAEKLGMTIKNEYCHEMNGEMVDTFFFEEK